MFLRHPVSITLFHKFRNKYLRTTWHEYTKHDLENGNVPKFDIYMTGSDQVWNCKYTRGDSNFLLKFAPENALVCLMGPLLQVKEFQRNMNIFLRKNLLSMILFLSGKIVE